MDGEFLMPSFHQPRPRPGFLIDTSSSMEDSQVGRVVAEPITIRVGDGAPPPWGHRRGNTVISIEESRG